MTSIHMRFVIHIVVKNAFSGFLTVQSSSSRERLKRELSKTEGQQFLKLT